MKTNKIRIINIIILLLIIITGCYDYHVYSTPISKKLIKSADIIIGETKYKEPYKESVIKGITEINHDAEYCTYILYKDKVIVSDNKYIYYKSINNMGMNCTADIYKINYKDGRVKYEIKSIYFKEEE